MFRRKFLPVWIGVVLLSGMFLMGQDNWSTPPPPKYAFVTTWQGDGNIGGLAAADAICQTEAEEAELPGTYKAWLSDSGNSPSTRFCPS